MSYEKTEALIRLAHDMNGTAEGLSLLDIQNRYQVARRTAERMRDALERMFPGFEQANEDEIPKRWRIRNSTLLNKVIRKKSRHLRLPVNWRVAIIFPNCLYGWNRSPPR